MRTLGFNTGIHDYGQGPYPLFESLDPLGDPSQNGRNRDPKDYINIRVKAESHPTLA